MALTREEKRALSNPLFRDSASKALKSVTHKRLNGRLPGGQWSFSLCHTNSALTNADTMLHRGIIPTISQSVRCKSEIRLSKAAHQRNIPDTHPTQYSEEGHALD